MLNGRFPRGEFDEETMMVVGRLTRATIQLWRTMKERMLPTPAKFHYIFNMRELSRVFQVRKAGGQQRQLATALTAGCLLAGAVMHHTCRACC